MLTAIQPDFWTTAEAPQPSPATTLLYPPTYANGYHRLKQSNPTLYRQYRNHIQLCFDQKDYGWKDSKPVHLNTKDTLNFWLDHRNHQHHKNPKKLLGVNKLKSLSLKKIESHNADETTYYYTSNPSGKWALLMLDVDDKNGEAGPEVVRAVHDYLLTLFPDHFNQISTGGKGWHGYVLVKYPNVSVSAFRTLVKTLEDAIQIEVKRRFPELYTISKKPFEIKGLPALRGQHGEYITCGCLAKIPRLLDDAEIANYMATVRRFYTPAHLQSILDSLTTPSLLPSLTDIVTDTAVFDPVKRVSVTISVRGREAGGGTTDGWHPDPCTRMNNCAWQLTVSLKRPATEDEVWDAYHANGWDTDGDTDGNRRKLCREAAEWCATNYDPAKQEAFNITAAIEMVNRFATSEIRRAIKKRSRYSYTDEQLAAAMHVIERESLTRHKTPHLQFTVPNNSIVAMMAKLNVPFDDDEEMQIKRLRTIKMVLVESGLAEVVDAGWTIGIGKRYGLGIRHPKYAEYVQLKESFQRPTDAGIIRLSGR